jgi:hypothetical protein
LSKRSRQALDDHLKVTGKRASSCLTAIVVLTAASAGVANPRHFG